MRDPITDLEAEAGYAEHYAATADCASEAERWRARRAELGDWILALRARHARRREQTLKHRERRDARR